MFELKINKSSVYFVDDDEGNRSVVLYLTTDGKAHIKTKTNITRQNYKEILKPVLRVKIEENLRNTLVPVEYDYDKIILYAKRMISS